MSLVFTAKITTDALSHLLGGQEPRWLYDGPLAMPPLGLNRIQPGTLARQETRDDSHAFLLLLDLPVMCSNPASHRMAAMPRGVIPHQQPGEYLALLELFTAPVQELGGDGADRTPGDEAQPDLLWFGSAAHQQAITGQRFGIRIIGR